MRHRSVLALVLACMVLCGLTARADEACQFGNLCCYGASRPCECCSQNGLDSRDADKATPVPCAALRTVPKDGIRDACLQLLRGEGDEAEPCAVRVAHNLAAFSARLAAAALRDSQLRALAALMCRQVDAHEVEALQPAAAARHGMHDACDSIAAVGAGQLTPRAEEVGQLKVPTHCWAQYPDALPGIYDDLTWWATTGITDDHIDDMRARLVTPGNSLSHDGMVFHIIDNQLYSEPLHKWAHLPTAMYGTMLKALLRRYKLPDVTFFINVSDNPDQIQDASTARGLTRLLPIMKSCKTADSANILLPTYAMWESRVWRLSLIRPELLNLTWQEKEDVVFASYNPVAEKSNGRFTARYNENCTEDQDVRRTLARFANQSDPATWRVQPMINSHPLDIKEWGRFKYIAHLEGVTCSNKLEKAAMLGSLLLIEETGYISTLHRMLRPWVSYVPFFRLLPQELRNAVNALADKPLLAASIAHESTRLARWYNSLDGLGCQLMMTLTEYARLQRFAPRDLPNVTRLPYDEFLLWGFEREFEHDPERLRHYEAWLLDPEYSGNMYAP